MAIPTREETFRYGDPNTNGRRSKSESLRKKGTPQNEYFVDSGRDIIIKKMEIMADTNKQKLKLKQLLKDMDVIEKGGNVNNSNKRSRSEPVRDKKKKADKLCSTTRNNKQPRSNKVRSRVYFAQRHINTGRKSRHNSGNPSSAGR